MKTKRTRLTRDERDAIIIAGRPVGNRYPNNTEIARRLGISVNKVKVLIYQACIKLGARNRVEAIALAVRRGEIKLDELYSVDELAEFLLALHPDILRRMASLRHEGPENGQFQGEDDQIICTDRRQGNKLTKYERDVLTLAGRGLANREIADTLYLSIDTVGKFLNRAYTKLGASKRLDAVLLAIKRGEISLSEIYSFNELLEFLIPLRTESVNKISQILKQKLRQQTMLTGN